MAEKKLRHPEDVIWFGRHKGKTVQQLMEGNPLDLQDIIDTTEHTDFDDDFLNLLDEKTLRAFDDNDFEPYLEQ